MNDGIESSDESLSLMPVCSPSFSLITSMASLRQESGLTHETGNRLYMCICINFIEDVQISTQAPHILQTCYRECSMPIQQIC